MATDQRTRICVRCKIEKPLSVFVKGRARRDGYTNRCLECERKRKRGDHQRPRRSSPQKKLPSERICKYCRQTKPLQEFVKHKEYRGGRTYECNSCNSAKSLAEYHKLANDPAIGKAHRKRRAAHARRYWPKRRHAALKTAKAWKEANPEQCRTHTRNRIARKKAAEGFHTAEDIARILAAQHNRCAICSCSLLGKKYDVDHITPLSRGGSNWPRNLQITCRPCNRSKHAADPLEFMRRHGRLL